MTSPKSEPQFPHPGRLFPVCCAADILVDRFIEENQMNGAGIMCNFVFVDNLSPIYTDSTEIGDLEDEQTTSTTAPDSPFKGKSPEECYRLLRQLRLGASDIEYTSFVIVDERLLMDDTVLLINALDDEGREGEVRFLRASFEIVDGRLLGYLDGEFCSVGEDLEAVKGTEDAVLRG